MRRRRVVMKISGKLAEDDNLLAELAVALRRLHRWCAVLVHGGGPAIGMLLDKLGVRATFVAGQRVTDASTLEVVEMVLTGKINQKIVGVLTRHGVNALGISGRDAAWLQVRPCRSGEGALGFVGDIQRIRIEVLRDLTQAGYIPVISPVSAGPEGGAYNVNADWAAAKIASAWRADFLLYFGDTAGVLRNGLPLRRLGCTEASAMIRDGSVNGGMIPKLESALWALDRGVGKVRIVSWEGVETLNRALRKDGAVGSLIEKRGRG